MNDHHSRYRTLILDSRVLTIILLLSSALSLLIPAFLIRTPYTAILPISLFAAGLISLVYHRVQPDAISLAGLRTPIDTRMLLILWFALFSMSVFLYQNQGWSRSISIHILLLTLYVVPVLCAVYKHRHYSGLGLLLLTGILHRALIYFSSPVPFGNDTHFHYGHASLILESGGLESLQGRKELFSPFFHVTGAVNSLVLDIPIRKGAVFLGMGTSITIVGTVLVYYFAASYWNAEIAFLSATLYITSDRLVGYFLMVGGTTQLGLLFFVLTIYSTIKYITTNSVRYFGLFLISVVALKSTHQATTFITVGTVIGGLAAVTIVKGYRPDFRNIPLVLGAVLFSDWMVTMHRGRSFLDYILSNLLLVVSDFGLFGSSESGVDIAELGYAPASPMESTGYIHILPVGLLFFFAAFGILYWLRTREDSATIISFTVGGIVVLLMLIFAGSVLNLPFVPSRWFIHLYALLAIPAGVGLFGTLSLMPQTVRSPTTVLICLLLLTAPYVALMGGNHISAVDDPVFDDVSGAERMAFTESEAATIEHTVKFAEEGTTVHSDQLHHSLLRYYIEQDISHQSLYFDIINDELILNTDSTNLIINRQYLSSGHALFDVKINETTASVQGTPPIQSIVLEFSQIYQAESDCGGGSCGIYLPERQ